MKYIFKKILATVVIVSIFILVLKKWSDINKYDHNYKNYNTILKNNGNRLKLDLTRKKDFLKEYGQKYGYGGKIYQIVGQDLVYLKNKIYLNYTAAGLFRKTYVEKYMNYLFTNFDENVHSKSKVSVGTEAMINDVRERILSNFNVSSETHSVVFTSNATGGLKIVGEHFAWKKGKMQFSYLENNHNSVLGIRTYTEMHGANFKVLTEEELNEKNVDLIFPEDHENEIVPALFAYPAQSNFDGVKFPLNWIKNFKEAKNKKWYVLLDTAAYVPTNKLDLKKYDADFIVVSFYKIFGFPTGIGALIVKNESAKILNKIYFSGGTVKWASPKNKFKKFNCIFHEQFEDGTLNYHGISAINYGYDAIENLGIERITDHTQSLRKYSYERLSSLAHTNGTKLLKIYGKHASMDSTKQGSVITLNVIDKNGNYIDCNKVNKKLGKNDIVIRSGCHCNPGSCIKELEFEDEEMVKILGENKMCSSEKTIRSKNGNLMCSIRMSIGYLTTWEDVESFILIISTYIDK